MEHSATVIAALTKCYESKPILELLSKLDPQEVVEDLKQESFLYLLEMPASKLEGIVKRGELQAIALFIIKRTMTSKKTKFYRLIRSPTGYEIPTTYNGFIHLDECGQCGKEQQEQDRKAEERFGEAFMNYFYTIRKEIKKNNNIKQLGLF